MYLILKFRTTLGSLSKKGLYDLGSLNISRFKANTIVEDETWILVKRVKLIADVRISKAILSNINRGLQSLQLWINLVSTPKKNMHLMLASGKIVDDGRLSNAGLDRSEHITDLEGVTVNGITNISDEEDAESICEI